MAYGVTTRESSDQVFIDPTFFGIFVRGPLQSFVVNVCTLYSESCIKPGIKRTPSGNAVVSA